MNTTSHTMPLALPPPRLTLADAVYHAMPGSPDWKKRQTTIDPKPFALARRLILCANEYERAHYRESVSYWFNFRRRDFDYNESRRLNDLGIYDPDWAIEYAWQSLANRLVEWAEETAINRSINAERARIMRGTIRRRAVA
jgi:hypothetical protein